MTRLQQIEKMEWWWQNKPIKLTKMHSKQLLVVENTLITSKQKNWFNVSSEAWMAAINDVKRANRTADGIIAYFPKLVKTIELHSKIK